jgi:hypothetical protein
LFFLTFILKPSQPKAQIHSPISFSHSAPSFSCGSLLFTSAQPVGMAESVMKAITAANRVVATMIQTIILNLLFELRLALAQYDHVTFEQDLILNGCALSKRASAPDGLYYCLPGGAFVITARDPT